MPASSPRPRRSPGRRLRLLAAATAALALSELVVLLAVANWIGWWPVVGLVLAASSLGVLVVRTGTPRAMATVRELVGAGPTPDHHLSRSARTDLASSGAGAVGSSRPNRSALRQVSADLTGDVLHVAAGVAMIFPGLLSTLAGVLLLIPPVRTLVARRLSTRITRGAEARVETLMSSARVVGPTVVVGEANERATFTPGDGPVIVVKQNELER